MKRTTRPKPEPLVAFVCTGNRFRSPLAAARFRELCGPVPLRIDSYGTTPFAGARPLDSALRAASQLGLELDSHRPTVLRHGELKSAVLVIGFEYQHVASAVVDGGASPRVTFTLPELCGLLDRRVRADDDDFLERLAAVVDSADEARRDNPSHHVPAIQDPSTASSRVAATIAAEIDVLVTQLHAHIAGRRHRDADEGGNAATHVRVV